MEKEQVIIPKFLSDEFVGSFFSNCYQFLGKGEQSYWNIVLKRDYVRVKDIIAGIVNKTQKSSNLNDLKNEVDSKCKEAKKYYDSWCSEEQKTRRSSYSLFNLSEFNVHNAAVRERNNSYKSLMYWKLYNAYICAVLERKEDEELFFNDLGLKTVEDTIDTEYIRDITKKAKIASMTDSSEAIGKAKELLETTFKFVLEKRDVEFGPNDNLNSLSKKVRKTLGLDDCDNKGNGTKTLITGLNSIVSGLSEMRNDYGSGHGKEPGFIGLPVCYGRLAVSAASSYIEFILHVFKEDEKKNGDR